MDALVDVTVMCVLLFELHMCILRVRGSKGDGNAGVSQECDYIGGTRGSGVVSTDDDVLEMSMVRGV